MESTKTPITVLQTYCSRRDLHPEFDLISTHGRVHEPTFVYLVRIEGSNLSVEAKVSGLSKKKAKQSAALKALQLLAEKDRDAADELRSLESSYLNELKQETDEVSTNKSNPVGKLQETCVKMKWMPPVYETDDEDGPAHDKKFTVCCRLENLKVVAKGVDRSKKGAKKFAALEMLDFLEREGICDPNDTDKSRQIDCDSKSTKEPDPFSDIGEVKSKLSPEVMTKLKEIDVTYSNYADCPDFCQDLKSISSSLNCKVDYLTLDDQVPAIFAQVTSLGDNSSLITGWGIDDDLERARQDSAKKAIHLLKIMFSS